MSAFPASRPPAGADDAVLLPAWLGFDRGGPGDALPQLAPSSAGWPPGGAVRFPPRRRCSRLRP